MQWLIFYTMHIICIHTNWQYELMHSLYYCITKICTIWINWITIHSDQRVSSKRLSKWHEMFGSWLIHQFPNGTWTWTWYNSTPWQWTFTLPTWNIQVHYHCQSPWYLKVLPCHKINEHSVSVNVRHGKTCDSNKVKVVSMTFTWKLGSLANCN